MQVLPTAAYWRDAIPLAGLAVWSGSRAMAYLPILEQEPLPGGVQLLVDGTNLPIVVTVYGVLWALAALAACFGLVFRRCAPCSYLPSLSVGVLATVLYAGSFGYSVVDGNPSREWLTASGYLGQSALIVGHVLTRGRRSAT